MTDVDSTLAFLRDKKIQKMLEGNAGLRIRREEETDYSDSEDGMWRFGFISFKTVTFKLKNDQRQLAYVIDRMNTVACSLKQFTVSLTKSSVSDGLIARLI